MNKWNKPIGKNAKLLNARCGGLYNNHFMFCVATNKGSVCTRWRSASLQVNHY